MSSSKDTTEGMEKTSHGVTKGVQQRTPRIKNYKEEEKVRQANKKLGEKQAFHRRRHPYGP